MRTRLNSHGIRLSSPFVFEVDEPELERRRALAAARGAERSAEMGRPCEAVLRRTRPHDIPDEVERRRWAAWDRGGSNGRR